MSDTNYTVTFKRTYKTVIKVTASNKEDAQEIAEKELSEQEMEQFDCVKEVVNIAINKPLKKKAK